jgi:hypothetical protein
MEFYLVYMLDRLKLRFSHGRARSVDGGRMPICAVLEAYAAGTIALSEAELQDRRG